MPSFRGAVVDGPSFGSNLACEGPTMQVAIMPKLSPVLSRADAMGRLTEQVIKTVAYQFVPDAPGSKLGYWRSSPPPIEAPEPKGYPRAVYRKVGRVWWTMWTPGQSERRLAGFAFKAQRNAYEQGGHGPFWRVCKRSKALLA